MPQIATPTLINDITNLGALGLFKLASKLYRSTYITGFNETMVSIGEYRKYSIDTGMVALDPLQREHYRADLAIDLSREHLFLARTPFSPTSSFDITVPILAVIFAEGGRVDISCPDTLTDQASELLGQILRISTATTNSDTPNNWKLVELEGSHEFQMRVENAIEAISNTDLEKVVLSKALHISSANRPNQEAIFDRLVRDRPYSYLFSIENYLGASPELVVNLKGSSVTSHPLAGTAKSYNESTLLLSDKDNREHQIVVGQIMERLEALGISAQHQSKPTISKYGEIVHLGSRISGSLATGSPATSIEIAAHLAPTAAINGEPYETAIKYIYSNEPADRGFYGGLVGYQKKEGDGTWILNIRSIDLNDEGVMLRAGVGIVEKSDPVAEDLEATSKINAIASSILKC